MSKQCYKVVTKPGQLGWLLTHQSEKTVLPSVDKIRSVGLVTYPPKSENGVTKCWQNQVSWVGYLPTKVRKQCWQNQVSWVGYLPTKVRKQCWQNQVSWVGYLPTKVRKQCWQNQVSWVGYLPTKVRKQCWQNQVSWVGYLPTKVRKQCWQNQVSWVGYLPTKVRKQCYQVLTKSGGELCWLLTHQGQKTVFQSTDNIGPVVLLLTHQEEKWELKSVRKTKLTDQESVGHEMNVSNYRMTK